MLAGGLRDTTGDERRRQASIVCVPAGSASRRFLLPAPGRPATADGVDQPSGCERASAGEVDGESAERGAADQDPWSAWRCDQGANSGAGVSG